MEETLFRHWYDRHVLAISVVDFLLLLVITVWFGTTTGSTWPVVVFAVITGLALVVLLVHLKRRFSGATS